MATPPLTREEIEQLIAEVKKPFEDRGWETRRKNADSWLIVRFNARINRWAHSPNEAQEIQALDDQPKLVAALEATARCSLELEEQVKLAKEALHAIRDKKKFGVFGAPDLIAAAALSEIKTRAALTGDSHTQLSDQELTVECWKALGAELIELGHAPNFRVDYPYPAVGCTDWYYTADAAWQHTRPISDLCLWQMLDELPPRERALFYFNLSQWDMNEAASDSKQFKRALMIAFLTQKEQQK